MSLCSYTGCVLCVLCVPRSRDLPHTAHCLLHFTAAGGVLQPHLPAALAADAGQELSAQPGRGGRVHRFVRRMVYAFDCLCLYSVLYVLCLC